MKSYIQIGVVGLLMPGAMGSVYAVPEGAGASALYDLEAKVTELEEDVRHLRGRLEALEHKAVSSMATSSTAVDPGANPALSVTGGNVSEGTLKDDPSTADAYNKALDLLQSKKHDEALAAFGLFEKKYPQSPLREMALYWMGVIYVIRQEHGPALETFESILATYPLSSKKCDILLKMARTHHAQGASDKACRTLRACLMALKTKPYSTNVSPEIASQAKALAAQWGCGESA